MKEQPRVDRSVKTQCQYSSADLRNSCGSKEKLPRWCPAAEEKIQEGETLQPLGQCRALFYVCYSALNSFFMILPDTIIPQVHPGLF